MTDERATQIAEVKAEIKRLTRTYLDADRLYRAKETKFEELLKKQYGYLNDKSNTARESVRALEERLLDLSAEFKQGSVVSYQGAGGTLGVITSRDLDNRGSVCYLIKRILPTGKLAQRSRYNRKTGETWWARQHVDGGSLAPAPETHPLYIKYMRVAVMNRLQGK